MTRCQIFLFRFHMKTHHANEHVKCEVCEQAFKSSFTLKKHMQVWSLTKFYFLLRLLSYLLVIAVWVTFLLIAVWTAIINKYINYIVNVASHGSQDIFMCEKWTRIICITDHAWCHADGSHIPHMPGLRQKHQGGQHDLPQTSAPYKGIYFLTLKS